MNEVKSNSESRLARWLAYALLVCGSLALTFELGRQRGFVDAHRDMEERANHYAVETNRMLEELYRLRTRAGNAHALAWLPVTAP